MNSVIEIFFAFMKIGAFSFGGGLAMLPLIEKEIVHNHHWLTSNEFVDVIAIAQITPGPIAVNASTFVGYKVAALSGALAGSLGVVIVSFILITILARYFLKIKDREEVKGVFKGIRPTVLGLILSAAVSVGKTSLIDLKSMMIAVIIFLGITKYKIHPILAIAASAVMGVILF